MFRHHRVSVAGSNLQACSFNHSDISPSLAWPLGDETSASGATSVRSSARSELGAEARPAVLNSDMAPAVLLSRARDAAARAVQADPALADAHAAVGYVRFLLEWDWPGAEAALRCAVALDASCAVGVRTVGHLLSQTARHAEARAVMSRLREIDPLYAMNHAMSAQVAFQARDYAEALAHARRAIVIDPEFWIGPLCGLEREFCTRCVRSA